ncbi:MAG: hypothetical protein COA65_08780 [Rhodospirillaceae bacterium]|nr:MAG: hypothetical protein COA65_08780 [Rhodospirillaceae bacterium]
MKYSITVLKAEIKRFENHNDLIHTILKECKNDKKEIKQYKEQLITNDKQIKELKADIAKL